jgi:hypothetical protein
MRQRVHHASPVSLQCGRGWEQQFFFWKRQEPVPASWRLDFKPTWCVGSTVLMKTGLRRWRLGTTRSARTLHRRCSDMQHDMCRQLVTASSVCRVCSSIAKTQLPLPTHCGCGSIREQSGVMAATAVTWTTYDTAKDSRQLRPVRAKKLLHNVTERPVLGARPFSCPKFPH